MSIAKDQKLVKRENRQSEVETIKEKLKIPEKKEILLLTKKISTQDTIISALTEESSHLKQKVLQLSKSYGERDDASELEKENQAMADQLKYNLSEIEKLE